MGDMGWLDRVKGVGIQQDKAKQGGCGRVGFEGKPEGKPACWVQAPFDTYATLGMSLLKPPYCFGFEVLASPFLEPSACST